MTALFGPPPLELIARYHSMRGYQWPHVIQGEDEKACESAEQYFAGPFFDEDGILFTSDTISDVR